VSGFLDTSVVVRYLTGDPPDLAERAAAVIDRDEPLHLTDVVVAETFYVLTSVYGVPRDEAIDALIAFVQRVNVAPFPLGKGRVLEALTLGRGSERVSVADALVWAAARATPEHRVYTFDLRFPRSGVEVRDRPPPTDP
jgi:predicted nucleic acid-binding protein